MAEPFKQSSQEAPKRQDIGVLYERVPEAGIVIQGYDIDELLTRADIHETEVADVQRELGVNRAVSFKPGIKDRFHWEYSEYMNFDEQNRPIATNKHGGGIFYTRLFEYDQLGRLVKLTDDFGFIQTDAQEFVYLSETPDENGHFPFTVTQSNESHLRTSVQAGNLYHSVVKQKSEEGVNAQIDGIIASQMSELRDSGAASVVYEPWKETYYKVEGGWKGPGGFFGNGTELANELNTLLASSFDSTNQTTK